MSVWHGLLARLLAPTGRAIAERLADEYEEGYQDGLADARTCVEAAIAPWPPGARKGDVIRALGES